VTVVVGRDLRVGLSSVLRSGLALGFWDPISLGVPRYATPPSLPPLRTLEFPPGRIPHPTLHSFCVTALVFFPWLVGAVGCVGETGLRTSMDAFGPVVFFGGATPVFILFFVDSPDLTIRGVF